MSTQLKAIPLKDDLLSDIKITCKCVSRILIDFITMMNKKYKDIFFVFHSTSEFNKSTFPNALQTISNIKKSYNNFGGVFVWEYYYAPPLGSKNPNEWSKEIYNTINKTR